MTRSRHRIGLGIVNTMICYLSARVAGVEKVHLYRTLALARNAFRAWLLFGGVLAYSRCIPRVDTEMVILRVAWHADCRYEMDHHVPRAERLGVPVAAIFVGPHDLSWSPRHRALLNAVDAIATSSADSATACADLTRFYEQSQIVHIAWLATEYQQLAAMIQALRIARDFR